MEVAVSGCEARDMPPAKSREGAVVGEQSVVDTGTVPIIGAAVVFGDIDCIGGDLAPGMLVNPLGRPGIAPVRSGGSAGVGIGLICGGSPLGGRSAVGTSPACGLTAVVEAASAAAAGAAEV